MEISLYRNGRWFTSDPVDIIKEECKICKNTKRKREGEGETVTEWRSRSNLLEYDRINLLQHILKKAELETKSPIEKIFSDLNLKDIESEEEEDIGLVLQKLENIISKHLLKLEMTR